MDVINERMKFCKKCNKATLHKGNGKKINWVMHLVLMLFFGLGIITLAFAVMGKTLSINGKMHCSECGEAN